MVTILTALPVSIRRQMLMLDYLMPAELFPFTLTAGLLLLGAGLQALSRHGLIAWGLGLAVAMLVGSQALAVVTGLASGKIEPVGWPWVLVLALLALYVLAIMSWA